MSLRIALSIACVIYASDYASAGMIIGRFHGEDYVCCGSFVIRYDPTPIARQDGGTFNKPLSLTIDWARPSSLVKLPPGDPRGQLLEIDAVHFKGTRDQVSYQHGLINWPTAVWSVRVEDLNGFDFVFKDDQVSYRAPGGEWHDEAIAAEYRFVPEPSGLILFALGLLITVSQVRRESTIVDRSSV